MSVVGRLGASGAYLGNFQLGAGQDEEIEFGSAGIFTAQLGTYYSTFSYLLLGKIGPEFFRRFTSQEGITRSYPSNLAPGISGLLTGAFQCDGQVSVLFVLAPKSGSFTCDGRATCDWNAPPGSANWDSDGQASVSWSTIKTHLASFNADGQASVEWNGKVQGVVVWHVDGQGTCEWIPRTGAVGLSCEAGDGVLKDAERNYVF